MDNAIDEVQLKPDAANDEAAAPAPQRLIEFGAVASSGSYQSIDYHVIVDFEDGARRDFVYAGYDPFVPGDLVALTPRGLERR